MRHRFQSNQSNKYGVGPKARRTRGAIVFDSILEATVYDDLVVRCRDGGDVLLLRLYVQPTAMRCLKYSDPSY